MRLAVIFLSLCCLALLGFAQPLSQGDRNRAMSELHATRKQILDTVASLTAAQWNFKPGPDRWSIAECLEHIILTEEGYIKNTIGKMLQTPPAPDKQASVKGKDEYVLKAMPDRTSKRKTAESLEPAGRWKTPTELIAKFKETRDRTIGYVESTRDDLHGHFAEHRAYGLLDGYQWLLLASAHSERHLNQMREVMADARYPKQ